MKKLLLSLIVSSVITPVIAQQITVNWSDTDGKLQVWDGQNTKVIATNTTAHAASQGNIVFVQNNTVKFYDGYTTKNIETIGPEHWVGIYGSRVAYRDGKEIKFYNAIDGKISTIYAVPQNDDFSNPLVVGVSKDLVLINVASRDSSSTKVWDGSNITDFDTWTSGRVGATDVDNNSFVWDQRPGYMQTFNSFLHYVKNFNHQEIKSNTFNFTAPKISGNTLVFEGSDGQNSEIFTWTNGNLTQITNGTRDQATPAISNGRLAWIGFDGNDYEVYTHKNNTTTKLTTDSREDRNVTVEGDYVAWTSQHGNNADIWVWNGSTKTRVTTSTAWDDAASISVNTCHLENGAKYAFKNVKSGKFMEVAGGSVIDGANIQQNGTTSPTHKQFVAVVKDSGYVGLKNVKSGRFMDVTASSKDNGANVAQLTTNANTYNRQFKLTAGTNGACVIRPRHSDKCVAVAGSSNSNGANVNQWACSGAKGQEWTVVKK